MYLSEHTFDHLRRAADEQRSRELEYRRIALEREGATKPSRVRGLRAFVQRFRRAAYRPHQQLSHP